MSIYDKQIQRLYITYYGRAADTAGLAHWALELEKAGGNILKIVNAFGNSPEYLSLVDDLSEEELINSLFQQAFGRDANDEGLKYYQWRLDTGLSTIPEVAASIAAGAQGEDAEALELRVEIAQLFTRTVAVFETWDEVHYTGSDASDIVRGFFTNVVQK